jgi:tetratricopeptide (TPR) repeat protein
MVDIYLQEMMHGREALNNKTHAKPQETSKFDIQVRKYVDEIITSMPEEDFYPTNQFETLLSKKEKRRSTMIAEANSLGFVDQITQAVGILRTEEMDLSPEQQEEIEADFLKAKKILDELDVSAVLDREAKEVLGIRQESIDLIFSLAIKKYETQEFEQSMALFLLLSKLDSQDPEYLYRAGIAAQVIGRPELALKLYAACLQLNSDAIGPKVFSIECQLELGCKDVAVQMYGALKEKHTDFEERWIPILANIESLLH